MAVSVEIYILNDESTDICLYLGDPSEEPNYPILEDYLRDKLIDPNSEEDLWQYWFDNYCCDEKELAIKQNSGVPPRELIGEMKQPLDPESGEAMSWLETEYEMRESPAAKMRTFLLKEIKGEMPGLKFFEGDRPGSNLCYCTADDMETVWRVKKSLESSGFETTIKYFSW